MKSESFRTLHESTTTNACGAAYVEHAAPCLEAEDCTRMRRGILVNGGGLTRKRRNC